MKGQYVAVESVLAFSLGLIAAVGIISIFGGYKDNVVDEASQAQAEIVESQLKDALIELSYTSEDSQGYRKVVLPENIGSRDYRVSMENSEIVIFVGQETYNSTVNFISSSKNLRGTVEGGEVRVYKRADEYILQPGR